MKKLLIFSLLFSTALNFAMDMEYDYEEYDKQRALSSFEPTLNCLQSCAVNTIRVVGALAPLVAVAARAAWGDYMDDDYIKTSAVLSFPIACLATPFSAKLGERLSLLLATKWCSSEYEDHVASCKKDYEEERKASEEYFAFEAYKKEEREKLDQRLYRRFLKEKAKKD